MTKKQVKKKIEKSFKKVLTCKKEYDNINKLRVTEVTQTQKAEPWKLNSINQPWKFRSEARKSGANENSERADCNRSALETKTVKAVC